MIEEDKNDSNSQPIEPKVNTRKINLLRSKEPDNFSDISSPLFKLPVPMATIAIASKAAAASAKNVEIKLLKYKFFINKLRSLNK